MAKAWIEAEWQIDDTKTSKQPHQGQRDSFINRADKKGTE